MRQLIKNALMMVSIRLSSFTLHPGTLILLRLKMRVLVYLSIKIDDRKDSSRNIVASDALIFAVDGVVESSVAAADHAQPGADAEGVEITAVAVPNGAAVPHDRRPAKHPGGVVDVGHLKPIKIDGDQDLYNQTRNSV